MAPFFFKENHNRSHSRTSYNLTDTSCVITGCTALPGKRQRDGIPNPRAGIWAPCCTIGPSGTFTAQQELEHFCLWAPNFQCPASATDAQFETIHTAIQYPREPAHWAGRQLKQAEGKLFKATEGPRERKVSSFSCTRELLAVIFQLGS